VRNAFSASQVNSWQLHATQDGVVRERNAEVEGFPLRQLRTVGLAPTSTLAGVVHNSVSIQIQSERPITSGAGILVVAPEGFSFASEQVTSSLTNLPSVQSPADGMGANSIHFQMSRQDSVPPNTYFSFSIRARNPPATPSWNYWNFYIKTRNLEHIDFRKYFEGFVIAHLMFYCRVYPNTVPWDPGTPNELSVFMVTRYPIFVPTDTGSNPHTAKSQLILVAPSGFTFPVDNPNERPPRCSSLRRMGGKDTYMPLPETQLAPITCVVWTARSIILDVPVSTIEERRYGFRLNVTIAANRDDIALQDVWRLTVQESSQILHIGTSPSPLIGTYYEAEWFWVSDQDLSRDR